MLSQPHIPLSLKLTQISMLTLKLSRGVKSRHETLRRRRRSLLKKHQPVLLSHRPRQLPQNQLKVRISKPLMLKHSPPGRVWAMVIRGAQHVARNGYLQLAHRQTGLETGAVGRVLTDSDRLTDFPGKTLTEEALEGAMGDIGVLRCVEANKLTGTHDSDTGIGVGFLNEVAKDFVSVEADVLGVSQQRRRTIYTVLHI